MQASEMKTLYALSRMFIFVAAAAVSSGCASSGEHILLADPTIFAHDGTYYLYGTGSRSASRQGFEVYTSTDLKSWSGPHGARDGFALRKGDAFGTGGFWAPQVFAHRGKFYMAYTANEHIAIAESDSPLGPFTQAAKQPLAAPVKQIDPFVFMDDGKTYLYHVRVADGANRIFVAELKDEFSGIKPDTLTQCITATQPWEDVDDAPWFVTEGPTVVKRGDLYYLIYSANHYRSKDYAVGYAVAGSPYGPWQKHEGNPILHRSDVNSPGTGHGDLFRGTGNDLYYVFHTHHSDSEIGPRKTALIKIEFVRSPSGGPEQLRVKAESFRYLQKAG